MIKLAWNIENHICLACAGQMEGASQHAHRESSLLLQITCGKLGSTHVRLSVKCRECTVSSTPHVLYHIALLLHTYSVLYMLLASIIRQDGSLYSGGDQ